MHCNHRRICLERPNPLLDTIHKIEPLLELMEKQPVDRVKLKSQGPLLRDDERGEYADRRIMDSAGRTFFFRIETIRSRRMTTDFKAMLRTRGIVLLTIHSNDTYAVVRRKVIEAVHAGSKITRTFFARPHRCEKRCPDWHKISLPRAA